jgi:hypothetical protein
MSSLTEILVYKVPGEFMAKFCKNPNLCRKVKSAQISPIQQPSHSPIAVNRNPLTVWSRGLNHWKVEIDT